MALSMKKLGQRATTFAVAASFLLVFILLLPKWVLHIFLGIVGILGIKEAQNIAKGHHQIGLYRAPLVLTLVYGIGSIYLPEINIHWLPYLVVLVTALLSLYSKDDVGKRMPQFGLSLVAATYLGFALICLAYIFQMETGTNDQLGRYLVIVFVGTVWCGDSFAYIGGSIFGKHKIAPVLSPNKSWEGMIANLLGNTTALYLGKLFFIPELRWLDILVLTFVFGLLGFFGDLVESSWKRGSSIKDSSTIFPGHGGVLDRIDSIFLTAPIFYFYIDMMVL